MTDAFLTVGRFSPTADFDQWLSPQLAWSALYLAPKNFKTNFSDLV
jgi:hypothetical protein